METATAGADLFKEPLTAKLPEKPPSPPPPPIDSAAIPCDEFPWVEMLVSKLPCSSTASILFVDVTLTFPATLPLPPPPPTLAVSDAAVCVDPAIPAAIDKPPLPPLPPMDCARIALAESPFVPRAEFVFSTVTSPAMPPFPPEPPTATEALTAAPFVEPARAPEILIPPTPPLPPMDCTNIPSAP